MKKLLIAYLILFSLSVFGQEINPLDTLYTGGAKAFGTNFIAKIKTPFSSMQMGNYGVLILEISVNENGEASFQQMTFLDKTIKRNIKTAYPLGQQGWASKGSSYKIYQPIIYSPDNAYVDIVSKEINGFTGNFNYPILGPYIQNIQFNAIVEKKSLGYGATQRSGSGATRQKTSVSTVNTELPEMANLTKLKKKLNDQLRKGKEKKAFRLANEYLRYNPFDIEILKERMRLAESLKNKTYREFDASWLMVIEK